MKTQTAGGQTQEWKCNTPGLLKEVMQNHSTAILAKPLQIFANILYQVGERAAKINDPALNKLMCRLAIYEIADPYSPNANEEMVKKVMEIPDNNIAPTAPEMLQALERVLLNLKPIQNENLYLQIKSAINKAKGL